MTTVSILIAAHDAQATLADTLASVQAQQMADWEAIVVDDGSRDGTAAVVTRFAKDDPRIRLVQQPQGGAAAARNTALAQATGEWIAFLDSDDSLALDHLHRMLDVAAARPDADLIHCGWYRTLDGQPWWTRHPAEPIADAFSVTARYCPFAIHAALFKRSAAPEGGFDTSLKICEDWDFWQRMARAGAVFAPAEDLWAVVSLRAGSLSSDAARHLRDGLTVLRRGYGPDPRVASTHPAYTDGLPETQLPAQTWMFALWTIGAAIGRGQDAQAMLESIGIQPPAGLSPQMCADIIEDGIVVGAGRPGAPWPELWPKVAAPTMALFDWLNRHAAERHLGDRIRQILERRIIDHMPFDRSMTVGRVRHQAIDISQPIADLLLPDIDHFHGSIHLGARHFGSFDRKCFGALSSTTIAAEVKALVDRKAVLNEILAARLARAKSGEERLPLRLRLYALRQTWRDAGVPGIIVRQLPLVGPDAILPPVLPAGPDAIAAESRAQTIIEAETRALSPAGEDAEQDSSGATPWTPPDYTDESYWESVFSTVDPWGYRNPYETHKYEQTIDLIRGLPIGNALEIACAEGEFSKRLAPLVGHLLATDIAPSAVARAAENCAGMANIDFMRLDLLTEAPPGTYDLIVCSEVLYYVADEAALSDFAAKVSRHLNPGGWLVVAHANLLVDEPEATGFGWPHSFGAKGIGALFAAEPTLALSQEVWTPLYRIQRFRKGDPDHETDGQIVIANASTILPERVASQVRWRGGRELPVADRWHDFPILAYHRIAIDGPDALARYRVAPATFEEQLKLLRAEGWQGISMQRLMQAMMEKLPVPKRSVMFTFDDATRDFMTDALPLLHRYGFPASVFVPAGRIGGTADWDGGYGEPAALLDWNDLRMLRHCDVAFGAHGVEHVPLSVLPPAKMVEELVRGRLMLEKGLEQPVPSIAYPYGDFDGAIRDLAGECGYRIGLSCVHGVITEDSDPLALRRIEIGGDMDLTAFRRTVMGQG